MNSNKFEKVVDAYLALPNSKSSNPIWHRMLRRVTDGLTAIVPVRHNKEIWWLVLQSDRKTLDDQIREIEAYMFGYCESFSREIRFFNDVKTRFSEVCSEIYPDGYYMFKSGEEMEEFIGSMLYLWIELDARRPVIREMESEVSSFTLRTRFHALIATKDWDESKKVLETIRQGRYVSDENYHFLKIQWLSSQNKWSDIYHSEDFYAVSHLDHIPTKIKESLLFAYYNSEIAEHDVCQDFDQAVIQYQLTRYKVNLIMNKTVFQGHIPHLRLMAYEAYVQEDWPLLEYLQTKCEDDGSMELITRLLKSRTVVADVPIEEQVGAYLTERRYAEAFEWVQKLEPSLTAMKFAAKIASMTESDEAFCYANARWLELSDSDQNYLLQEPDCKSDLKILLVWANDKKSESDIKDLSTITWNTWFAKLLQPDTSGDELDQWLRKLESDQSGIVWSDSAMDELSELMMGVALDTFTGQRGANLEMAFPIICSEIVTHERFPDNRAEIIYSYLMELMVKHAKRNPTNTAFWLQLTEGSLTLDISNISVQWLKTKSWFEKIDASKVMLPSLLGALELFLDFGGPLDEITSLWMNWTGALGNSIALMDKDMVAGWIDLGHLLNVPTDWIQTVGRAQTDELITDSLKNIEDLQVTIFTLREDTARRAVERLKSRNQAIKYTIIAAKVLTTEAKAHAKNTDIAVIVTACLSHALFYGIQPLVKDKIAYPRNSSSTEIVKAIEAYIDKNFN